MACDLKTVRDATLREQRSFLCAAPGHRLTTVGASHQPRTSAMRRRGHQTQEKKGFMVVGNILILEKEA